MLISWLKGIAKEWETWIDKVCAKIMCRQYGRKVLWKIVLKIWLQNLGGKIG